MTEKRKKGKTLAEHDAFLKAEGRYDEVVDRLRERDREHEARAAELMRAEAPLIEQLRVAGCGVSSVWDLVNSSVPYPAVIPILLQHVTRPYPAPVREGIARALAVPEARAAWDVLTKLYHSEQIPRVKDGLAVAIAVVADDAVIDEVIALARDRRNGASRLLLLGALERSKGARSSAALTDLSEDPELKEEIRAVLRRRKRRLS